MRILNRKTPLQRFLDSVNDTLDVPDGLRFDLPRGKLRQGTEGGPDRRRRPSRPHGGERRDLLAQAPQGRGEGRFVKLGSVAVFAAGYIIGARAGRERYAQIVDVLERASHQLEEFSSRHPPGRSDDSRGRVSPGSLTAEAPVRRSRRRGVGPRAPPGHQALEARCDRRPRSGRCVAVVITVIRIAAGASARSAHVSRARSDVVGGRLAHAVRSIDEGAELLAEARRRSP